MMISIVIPTAKEDEGLYDHIYLFSNAMRVLSETYGFLYEILLVSDVFHPPTINAMRKLAEQNIARCYLLTRRIGKGGSVKNAIPYTRGDYVVLLDADIPVSANTVCRLVLLAAELGLDLLVANRVYRAHSLLRRLLSTAYNSLVTLLFRTGIKDHQAGFKILSRRAANTILVERVRTDGFAYDTEIIVWAKKHNMKYKTVNVTWNERRAYSTIPPLRALLTMLADLVILRLLTLGKKYVALQKLAVGNIIDLNGTRTVGQEFITIIRASGSKKLFLSILRKLYAAVAFSRK